MPNIKLVSSDKKTFVVDVATACCSETIKTMLEDLGMCEEGEEEIPLPKVSGEILEKVITWAEHHKNDSFQEPDSEVISEWDLEFLKVQKEVLFELTKAANYLDVKGLLYICCRTVANMIKGKSTAQIRELFELK